MHMENVLFALFVRSFVGVFVCLLGCLFVCLLGCWGVCLFVCLFVYHGRPVQAHARGS